MKKDEQIIKRAKKDKIPIFVFIATDVLALKVLAKYEEECKLASCTQEQIDGVNERIHEFTEYQATNLTKLPD